MWDLALLRHKDVLAGCEANTSPPVLVLGLVLTCGLNQRISLAS